MSTQPPELPKPPEPPEPPQLLTFDIFGTVVDWRRGLALSDAQFERVIDRQAELEQQRRFRPYAEIVAQSLVDVLRMNAVLAAAAGAQAGRWPLFADSRAAMEQLRLVAPCVAMTNSDRAHGAQVQEQLGPMDGWICAEDLRLYKPDARFWHETARRRGVVPGPRWWHVSAYADYDHRTAKALGLTCVLVRRPHSRPRAHDLEVHDLEVRDLAELAALLESRGRT